MQAEKIKQLKNTAWIVRFIDGTKSYVRFVSDSVVSDWTEENEEVIEFSCNRVFKMHGSKKQIGYAFDLVRRFNKNITNNALRNKMAEMLYNRQTEISEVIDFCLAN